MNQPAQSHTAHICMVVTTDFYHDRRVRKEALSVLESGFRLTVVATRRPEDEVYQSAQLADDEFDGYPFSLKRVYLNGRTRRVNIPVFSAVAVFFWVVFFYLKILATIFSVRADIYHCHDIDALALARLPALFHRGRVIFDCHDIMSEIQIRGSVLARLRPVFRMMERLLPPTAHGLIAAAQPFAKRMAEASGIDEKEVVPVLNCPRTHSIFNSDRLRKRFEIASDCPVLLYLGSINPDRGLSYLMEVIDQLESSIAVVILGPGHPEIREALAAQIASIETGDRVYLGDFVALEEVPETLMGATATIIPNRYISEAYNSLPNKLFEAMMAGRPFVCNNIPAMAKIVQDQECGIVLQDEQPQTLSAELNRLLLDPKLSSRLGKNGRNAAEKIYNWESQAENLLGLYDEVSRGKRGRNNGDQ